MKIFNSRRRRDDFWPPGDLLQLLQRLQLYQTMSRVWSQWIKAILRFNSIWIELSVGLIVWHSRRYRLLLGGLMRKNKIIILIKMQIIVGEIRHSHSFLIYILCGRKNNKNRDDFFFKHHLIFWSHVVRRYGSLYLCD